MNAKRRILSVFEAGKLIRFENCRLAVFKFLKVTRVLPQLLRNQNTSKMLIEKLQLLHLMASDLNWVWSF